ncbi:MAG TPA: hypothetical protein VF189_06975 [Patescibacteria group bacterium]
MDNKSNERILPLKPVGIEISKALFPVFETMPVSDLSKIIKKAAPIKLKDRLVRFISFGTAGYENLASRQFMFPGMHLNELKISSVSPEWLKPNAFMREIFRWNAPGLWSDITRRSPRYKLGLKNKLPKPDNFSESAKSWKEIQSLVYDNHTGTSFANASFISMGLMCLGLGVVLGPDFQECIKDQYSSYARAGLEASQKYATKAATIDEAFQRLHDVYTGEGHDLLIKNKAFEMFIRSQNGIRRCPFRFEPTQHFMQAVGQLFQDEEYKKYLTKQIKRTFFRRRDYRPNPNFPDFF